VLKRTSGGSSAGQNNVRPQLQVMTHNILNRMIHDAPEGDRQKASGFRRF